MSIKPSNLGFNARKFPEFRPNQFQTAMKIIGSEKRFMVLNAPVGSGKTLIYVAAMLQMEWRSLVLTITTALQRQLVNDFPFCVDIMGMGRYECMKDGEYCDTGSCHIGEECDYKYLDCHFYSQVRRARSSKMVVGNYAFNHYGCEIGEFDFLILDEAHKLLDVMTSLLSVRFRGKEIQEFCGSSALAEMPEIKSSLKKNWIPYLKSLNKKIEDGGYISKTDVRMRVRAKLKSRNLSKVVSLVRVDPDNWQITDQDGGFLITPIWPGKYFNDSLYKTIPHILFVSANITRKRMEYLGIERCDYDYFELPSLFAPKNRPFIYCQTKAADIAVDYKTTDKNFRQLVRYGIDKVIDQRKGRKGIIHSRSFFLADRIARFSRHSNIFLLNNSYNTESVVRQFKDSSKQVILVSPSLEYGYDFSYAEARFQILVKLPQVDSRGVLMKARCKSPGYAIMLVVESIIQMYGRSTRGIDDWSEVIIFDRYWSNFYKSNSKKFPLWFRVAYKRVIQLPKPLYLNNRQGDS